MNENRRPTRRNKKPVEFLKVPDELYIPNSEKLGVFVPIELDEKGFFFTRKEIITRAMNEVTKMLKKKASEKGEGYYFFSSIISFLPLNHPTKGHIIAECFFSKENVPKLVRNYEQRKKLTQISYDDI